MPSLTVAVIAGGHSSRMGTDKSFVPMLGKPLIEHVIARVVDLNQDETIVITNRPDNYAYLNLPMFADIVSDKGALGGIYTAIYHSQNEHTLCIACDMPFLNPDLLRYMIDLRDSDGGPYDVIVPKVDDHPQGLHAIYSKACLAPIRKDIDADRLKVIGFYDRVRVRYLEPAEYTRFDPHRLSFHNINTPDELQAARQLMMGE